MGQRRGTNRNQLKQRHRSMGPASYNAKSPTSSNARALRRQSITGIQPPEMSRRTSLGGFQLTLMEMKIGMPRHPLKFVLQQS
ncbi:hypothetical protein Pfo_028262 [Paulownia fortunei]|nr:hypothetical protein Pfo_028262 [Paulownia fortunei]